MKKVLMLAGLLVIPSVVGWGVYELRRHALQARIESARAALGKHSCDVLLEQLRKDYPDNAEARFLRAQQLRFTGQGSLALESLKEAAQLGWPKGQIERERLLLRARIDFLRVQDQLQPWLDRDQLDRDVLLALAQGFAQNKYYERADSLVTRWLLHKPDDGAALFLRGQIAMHSGKWDQARQDLSLAIQGGPDDYYFPDARRELAAAYVELGRFEEALPLLRECRKVEPQNTDVLFNLGQCAAFLQHYDEALDAFHEAQRIQPTRENVLKIAHIHELRNEFPQALELLQKSETGDPKDMEVLSSMARVLQALGRVADAKKYRERYDSMKSIWSNQHLQSEPKH